MREPRTDRELQDAVNAAKAMLLLDSARQYGLVTGGPSVNVERCLAVLEDGAIHGIFPASNVADQLVTELLA